ncbi:hypothetical protein K3495_g6057, partial [Podosphaera aphanis]
MTYGVPEDTDSSEGLSSDISIEFHSASELPDLNSNSDDTPSKKALPISSSQSNIKESDPGSPNPSRKMHDEEMDHDAPNPTTPSQTLSPKDVEMLTNLVTALNNAAPETSTYLRRLMKGKDPMIPESSGNQSSSRNFVSSPDDKNFSTEGVIKRDAKFEKWDGESLSWTPHYYFLKVQCEVYEPLLVTQKAVCMKIYESIPEPKRQRIRGYWIKCGEADTYDWKEMLEACNKEYFDKVGAQKAEKKLLAMRQGESQVFRSFLQEWELQLEFAGGRKWPDDIKINQLSIAVSEKIREKFSVLDLPTEDYQSWVNIITRVTAVMENSEKFVKKGEAQTTQYATRSGMLVSEYLAGQSVVKAT